MNVTRREAIAGLGAAAASAALPAAAAPERAVIPGVDRFRVCEPVFEAVRVVLSKRGEKLSPAYVQGISGAAFRVGGPCPCAPTCCGAMGPADLLRMVGYDSEPLSFPDQDRPQPRLREALARVRGEVLAGRPVLVFHAFTSAEWDVVCGFDQAKGRLYGRGSYAGLRAYAEADEARMITCKDLCGIGGAIVVGEKTGRIDAARAEANAVREAVEFARSRRTEYPYRGLQAYDVWVARFSGPIPVMPDFAVDGYTSGVYRSSRRAAVDFLREIRPRHPRASRDLAAAAGHFAVEAGALDRLRSVLFEGMPRNVQDPDVLRRLNADAVLHLSAAREAYRAGIGRLERAAAAMSA